MCGEEFLKKQGLYDRVVVGVLNDKNYKFDNNVIIKGIKLKEELNFKS